MSNNESIIVAWIGSTDLFCMNCWRLKQGLEISKFYSSEKNNSRLKPKDEELGKNGPIRTITDELNAKKVYLLCSEEFYSDSDFFSQWVKRGTGAAVTVVKTGITDPTDYDSILNALEDFKIKYWSENNASNYIFQITSGTPAMQAVTLYMVANRFIGSKTYKTVSPEYVNPGQSQFCEVKFRFSLPDMFLNAKKSSEYTISEDKVKKIVEVCGRFSSVSILLLGETGVGKSEFAKEIHRTCGGSDEKFVSINCAEISAGDGNLLRSALFGHKKGAFTGADSDMKGAFERAQGGTLFLDEIAEIPIDKQAILLKAIQDRVICPVGGKDIKIKDVRIISATNKELISEVEKGNFREDLYYRIAMCPVKLPTLREIIANDQKRFKRIIDNILDKISTNEFNIKNKFKLTQECFNFLCSQRWPGNIRQLTQYLLLGCLFANNRNSNEIAVSDIEDFNNLPVPDLNKTPQSDDFIPSNLIEWLENKKKAFVKKALEQCDNNRSKAAKMLGCDYQYLNNYYKKINNDK